MIFKLWVDRLDLMRNSSASLRASIRSPLLPFFDRAFLRGSQNTSRLT